MPEITDARLERTALFLCCSFEDCKLPYLLARDDFADGTYGDIFASIQQSFREKNQCQFTDLCTKFDPFLLMNAMNIGDIYWPSTEESVAKSLRELRIQRTARAFSVSEKDAKAIIDRFSQETKKLTELLPDAKRDTLDVFNELYEKPVPWIPTGFPSVDDFVHMHRGDLITVGARTRHGKTSFLINVACHALRRGERVDFLTKEMQEAELLARFIECLTSKKVEEGKKIINTEILTKLSIHTISSVADVAAVCASTDSAFVMVDYIQILASGRKSENRVTDLEYITTSLKDIAMSNNVCLMSASQISRSIDTSERDPVLSDLRGSGSIEQDSNVVILLFNHAEEKKTKSAVRQIAQSLEGKREDVDVIIAKNRNGKSGRCTLKWNGEICTFTDSSSPLPHGL